MGQNIWEKDDHIIKVIEDFRLKVYDTPYKMAMT